MEQVMKTTTQTPIEIALGIDENGMTTVKKLFDFLGMSKNNYARWYKTNITDNQFAEENVDYFPFLTNEECGGQASMDSKITAHFAKKLSMMQKNERGEEAREYFTRLEERVKQKAIDYTQLSPELQRSFLLLENQAKLELELKNQAKEISQIKENQNRLEEKQNTIAETFSSPSDSENFQLWANKCISRIAESPNFHPEYGRQSRYALARNESYARLKKKWNCNLDDRVARAKGRAVERNPGITKAELNAINKLTIIANDKSLRPVYETVLKEMMIQYCVEVPA